MKILAGVLAAVGVFVLVACDNDSYEPDHEGFQPSEGCEQFTSCQACTPISGCGWCFDSNGNGQCASDPDECSAQSFSWTWNPSGCRVEADAGSVIVSSDDAASTTGATTSVDAGAPPVDAGSAADTARCAPPAGVALTDPLVDGASESCLAQPGGNLCPAAELQLGCFYGATPNPALSCSLWPVPTPSNVLFYCCPCPGDAVSTK